MYIQSLVARTFFCAQSAHCVLRTSSCMCHTHARHKAQVSVKRCLHMCRFSPSRHLPSHASPILAVPARSLRDHSRLRRHWRSRPHVLADLTCPKSAEHAQLRTCIAKFGYLAKSALNTGHEPDEFDKITSVDDDAMLIDDPDPQWNLWLLEKHTREQRTSRCSHLVWILCFARFSWWFRSWGEKQRKHAIGKPLLDREKEKKEKVLWSVLQSRCQRKVNGTVFVWVWKVSENSILMNEISEKTWNEELDKL